MTRPAGRRWPPRRVRPERPPTASDRWRASKDLANQTLQVQQQDYAGQGRHRRGQLHGITWAWVWATRLRRNSGPLNELVGIAIQRKILAQLDPSGSYDFLGRPITELQAELDRQKASIREALQVRDQLRPTLDETELNNYWEREKIYGEMYALQWLQSKHRQP